MRQQRDGRRGNNTRHFRRSPRLAEIPALQQIAESMGSKPACPAPREWPAEPFADGRPIATIAAAFRGNSPARARIPSVPKNFVFMDSSGRILELADRQLRREGALERAPADPEYPDRPVSLNVALPRPRCLPGSSRWIPCCRTLLSGPFELHHLRKAVTSDDFETRRRCTSQVRNHWKHFRARSVPG